jgi:pimeloyl-ACP methyl ester carboxylesterase
MDNWDPIITNTLAQRREVILFDNRGVGSSAGQTPDSVQAMATDALAFVDALGLKKIDLLGFSLGGTIDADASALRADQAAAERLIK